MVWMHYPVKAARLFGAVETFSKNIQKLLGRLDQYEYDRYVSNLRNAAF